MEAIGRSHVRYGVTLYQCRAGEEHFCHLWFAASAMQRESKVRTGSGPASLKSYKSKHCGLWWHLVGERSSNCAAVTKALKRFSQIFSRKFTANKQ